MKQIDLYYEIMNQNDANLAALDLNLITAMSALLEYRSVSAAAGSVGRTQSAMSHSLARLRDHFRDPLLVRDGWEMRLTPFAQELQPRVSAAAEAARLMFATSFGFDPATTTRRIRIAAPDLCTSLFTGLVSELAKQAPLACVEFIESSQARQAVLRSEADIGLGFGYPKSDPNLVLHEIEPLDWCTFAPDNHQFVRDTSVETWSASRHIIVGKGYAHEGPVEKALKKQGIKRHIINYASNFSAALVLASETNSLLTTLRAPFEQSAEKLGMKATPTPFIMADAPAVMMFRAEYGNPFSVWLKEICQKTIS